MSLGEGAGQFLPYSGDAGLRLEKRLDGWKEIASHFAKGERTVKRWEAERGLPVHRVPGGGRATVYAMATELDAWLQSNKTVALEALDRNGREPVVTASDARLPEPERASETVIALSAKNAQGLRKTLTAWRVGFGLFAVLLAAASYQLIRMDPSLASNGSVLPGKLSDGGDSPTYAEKKIARDLYLKARFEWSKRTPESLNRSLDYFNASLLHDSRSAPTYAGIADTYILLREYSLMPAHDAYSHAIEAATKAVSLDDTLADAHRSLAFAEVWGNWDFEASKSEFLRALDLNSNDALTHLWFATAFKATDWYSFTAAEFQRAQELDPTSSVVLANKSMWLFETGQRQEGVDLARQVEQANADFVAPHRYLAKMAWSLRDYGQFLLEADSAAQLQHDSFATQANSAARAGFARDGERGLLSALYEVRKQQVAAGTLAGTSLAEVCIRLGKNDEALRLLSQDYEDHRPEFLGVLSSPDLKSLEKDSRYALLVGKLHVPAPPSGVL